MQGRNAAQNCLAATWMVIQLKLKAWQKCYKKFLGKKETADVAKTRRMTEMLRKIAQ